jgi:hypothetical protein
MQVAPISAIYGVYICSEAIYRTITALGLLGYYLG